MKKKHAYIENLPWNSFAWVGKPVDRTSPAGKKLVGFHSTVDQMLCISLLLWIFKRA